MIGSVCTLPVRVSSQTTGNSAQGRDRTVLLNLYRLRGRLQEGDLQQVFAHHVDYYLEVISMCGKSWTVMVIVGGDDTHAAVAS